MTRPSQDIGVGSLQCGPASTSIRSVSRSDLEETLRTLHSHAIRVGGRTGRETWRFKALEKLYFAHFYPRAQKYRYALGRRGSASQEFAGLQTLQRLKIPSPRGVALLVGFHFGGRRGDLVIFESIGDAHVLGEGAQGPRTRAHLRDQVLTILRTLGKEQFGHADLRPQSFLVANGKVFFVGAAGIKPGGMKTDHLIGFAQRSWPYASRSDKLRVWRALVPKSDLPPKDAGPARWFRGEEDVEIDISQRDGLSSRYVRSFSQTPSWSSFRGQVKPDEWRGQSAGLIERVESGLLQALKRDASGEVVTDRLTLGGRELEVVIKRPQPKRRFRDFLFIFRVARARRIWEKTFWLVRRNLPVERPLYLFEPKELSERQSRSFIVFERVPGTTLADFDLDTLTPGDREKLFLSIGRILRRIEDTGLTHTDAKSSNWIVAPTPDGGVTPVMVDAYGIRKWNIFLALFGLRRLLRAMKQHPQYTPDDSRNICLGFSPFAPLRTDEDKP